MLKKKYGQLYCKFATYAFFLFTILNTHSAPALDFKRRKEVTIIMEFLKKGIVTVKKVS